MSRIIADSSVWIDFLNDRNTWQVELFDTYLNNSDVCLCPPVVQEVLQGLRSNESYLETKELMFSLEIIISESLYLAVEAADLYRSLRKKGVTIRKPNDCIIAWYAINNKVKLLHNDSDFDLIAEHTELKVVRLK